MSNLSTLKFFVTPGHDCSYLDDQEAKTLFLDPKAKMNDDLYSELSEFGFRRSGNFIYRPHCDHCNECKPVRIPVDLFKPNKHQKRVMKKNQDLEIHILPPDYQDEHYLLYEKYIAQRHKNGDMYPATEDQYKSFLLKDWGKTFFIEYRLQNQLKMVAVTDRLNEGLSAIYTFFDPDFSTMSPGVFSILTQIEYARSLDLPFLYLGYWIRQSQKMSYKIDYKPIEILLGNQWMRHSTDDSIFL